MTGRRWRGALAVAVLVVGSISAVGTPAGAQGQPTSTQPARSRLSLGAQTAFVGPGGEFMLRLRIDRASVPATSEIVITVHRAVQTRSEFEQTMRDRFNRTPLINWPVIALSSLTADASGDVSIRLPAQDLGLNGEDGVFPVRVELRERNGASLDRFVTHIVHFATTPVGPKLGVALVLPFATDVGLPADGQRHVANLDDVAAAAAALEASRVLPYALAPSPDTLAALAGVSEERAARALDSLRRVAAEHPVLASPYVPVSLPGLLAADLREEVSSLLGRGSAVVSDVLRVQPEARTWLAVEPLSPEAVDELVNRGVGRVVAMDPLLEPVPGQNVTLTRPFVVGGDEEEAPAASADTGLSAHFNAEPNQVLQAHHLLADLAVLWSDAPGDDRRAVVAAAPRQWKASRAFLEALSAGLSQSPAVEAISLDTMFTAIEPAVTGRGLPLVRNPAVVQGAANLGDVASQVRQSRRRLASLGSVVGASSPASVLLEERLLVAQSSELRTTRQRQDYLSAVETGIADQLEAIEMPQNRSITLTARRGQIPVTFQNRTGSPVQVIVTVESDKLEFPEGGSRPLELNRRNTTERFSVVARTSGAFPLSVTMVSPDGNLVIGRARLTVRSTAASGMSLFVSAGAALFLALWWGKHAARGRRARRLVPS